MRKYLLLQIFLLIGVLYSGVGLAHASNQLIIRNNDHVPYEIQVTIETGNSYHKRETDAEPATLFLNEYITIDEELGEDQRFHIILKQLTDEELVIHYTVPREVSKLNVTDIVDEWMDEVNTLD